MFRKLILKLVNEVTDKVEWIHLCYIDNALYSKFLKATELCTTDMNDIISRWAKEDFNIELNMSSSKDIEILKELIKDFYKRAHPELVIESATDRQGWVRVWITKKMKEELEHYGR